jgi:hypothetical protein
MIGKRRRRRSSVLAAYLICGAIVLQLGPMCSVVGNTGIAAFDFSMLLDENESLFGLFYPCGRPNTLRVDENGDPIAGAEIENTEDDMIYDCPVTYIVVETN